MTDITGEYIKNLMNQSNSLQNKLKNINPNSEALINMGLGMLGSSGGSTSDWLKGAAEGANRGFELSNQNRQNLQNQSMELNHLIYKSQMDAFKLKQELDYRNKKLNMENRKFDLSERKLGEKVKKDINENTRKEFEGLIKIGDKAGSALRLLQSAKNLSPSEATSLIGSATSLKTKKSIFGDYSIPEKARTEAEKIAFVDYNVANVVKDLIDSGFTKEEIREKLPELYDRAVQIFYKKKESVSEK